MTITFVGSTSTAVVNQLTFNFALPTALEDDIVIVVIGSGSQGGDDPTIGVTTSGYTEEADLFSDDFNDSNFSVSWKRMGATPDTSVDCEGSGGSGDYGTTAVAYVLRGVDTVTAIDVTTTTATGVDASIPDCASITPVTAGAWVVACGSGTRNDSSITAPSGYTDHHFKENTSTIGNTTAVCSKVWNGSGTEDPPAWTDWGTSSADAWCAATLAIRPVTLLTPPTGSITITGSTPAIGITPSSGSITLTGGTPTPAVAIPVSPTTGAITLTGTTPTPVSAAAVYPVTDYMQITGGTPVISSGMLFAGNSPAIAGSLIFENLIDFAGTTPPVIGELDFGEEFFFDVVSSLMEGTIDGATSFSGLTPNQTASFEIELEQYGSFTGKSPVMEGLFDFGGEFSGIAPQMTGSLSIELESYGYFNVKSPAMAGSIEVSQSLSFGGYSPAMTGTFETELEQYGSFVGTTPAMLGELVFEDGEFSFAGLTPSMEGIIELDVDNGISFALETPPTIGHINIGLLAAIGTPDSDISTTSDGIIRHRRVYDNG